MAADVHAGDHENRIIAYDVHYAVWESSHEGASRVFMDERVLLGTLSDSQHALVDSDHEPQAETGG